MGKFVDLTGQKFGNWLVLEYRGNGKWLCECQCKDKTIREVLGKTLKSGASKSCGCLGKVNIENKHFGDWLVLKQLDYQDALCKCMRCNRDFVVRISNLKSGASTKCVECAKKEQLHTYEDLANKMFGNWKPIKYLGNQKWLCECQCEEKTQKIVAAGDLKRGKTKSCGCIQFRDLTKEDIKADVINYIGNGYWKCKCNYCNTEYVAHRTDLLNGKDDCGCHISIKRQQTLYNLYGDYSTSKINNPRTDEQQNAVRDKQSLSSFIANNFKDKPTIYELSTQLGLSDDRMLKLVHEFGIENLVLIGKGSRYEDEIYNWISTLLPSRCILTHNRDIIKPKELDIYIPEKKIAIEFNGSYWHSDDIININDHRDKTLACARKGIHLIHIFEYEWKDTTKQSKIKSYIRGLINQEYSNKIYARSTEIKCIDSELANDFCEMYHLQGKTGASINYGCYKDNELLGVMTFGIPRFNNEYEYEIIRLCWKNDTKVIGGTEKIFSEFIRNINPNSIITYVDISKFTGNIYTKLGFKPIQPNPITEPNYVWVHLKKNTVLSRYQVMKHKLVKHGLGTEDQTEDEIMKNLGFVKIYNSGNLKLEWLKGEQ